MQLKLTNHWWYLRKKSHKINQGLGLRKCIDAENCNLDTLGMLSMFITSHGADSKQVAKVETVRELQKISWLYNSRMDEHDHSSMDT